MGSTDQSDKISVTNAEDEADDVGMGWEGYLVIANCNAANKCSHTLRERIQNVNGNGIELEIEIKIEIEIECAFKIIEAFATVIDRVGRACAASRKSKDLLSHASNEFE